MRSATVSTSRWSSTWLLASLVIGRGSARSARRCHGCATRIRRGPASVGSRRFFGAAAGGPPVPQQRQQLGPAARAPALHRPRRATQDPRGLLDGVTLHVDQDERAALVGVQLLEGVEYVDLTFAHLRRVVLLR